MDQEPPFGQLVRERRRALDLTQDELARRVGCAPVTVRKIEYGDMRPSAQVAERLAMALAVPLDERPAFVRRARAVRRNESPRQNSPRAPEGGAALRDLARLTGQAVRGYQLGVQIGSGGFGAVYRATQPLVEREVAVKVILPQYADHPDFIRRFEAEAQLVARLEHPHIVPLYDFWREPGVAFLVMRYLRGGSLQQQLQAGSPPMERTLQLVEQLCAALHVAHRAGVVHRDLKPANILLDEDGNAYLSDFGIAKDLRRPTDLSFAGAFVGSPAYSSPEQLRAEPVSPQTDIYALGVLLYELLTGQKPFPGPTPALLAQQHLNAPVPRLETARPGLALALDQIVQRALAKVPSARYADVREVATALRAATVEAAPAPATVLPAHAAPVTVVLDLGDEDNPYPGLRSFGEADAAAFFGRDALVQQLLVRLGEGGELSRFLAVVGPSGSGKSSAVRAGLLPALRTGALPGSEEWLIATLLPGSAPLESLAEALWALAPRGVEREDLLALLATDSRGLLRAARLVLPADNAAELLLVVDQFEECFTLCADEAQRSHLLDSLVTAVLDERSRLRIVVTLRADLLDRALQYIDFGELLRQRSELVLPLTPDELEQAIVGPARRAGLALEDGLEGALIGAVAAQPGALPLLQHALRELFVRRQGRVLTRAAYEAIGGVSGALAGTAEGVYAGLDTTGQAGARQLFLRLMTPGEGVEDTRRRVRLSELAAAGVSQAVVEAFGQARLLTFDHDGATREPTAEVAHEALLRAWPRLRGWIEGAREELLLQRRLAQAAQEWARSGRDQSFLASGARLIQYQALSNTGAIALTAEERAYLEAGVAEQTARIVAEQARQAEAVAQARALADEQRQRAEAARSAEQAQRAAAGRLRALVGALTVFLLVTAGLSVFAFTQQQTAQRNLTNSEARRLAAEAQRLALADGETTVIGLLAARALGTEYTPEGDAALAAAATLDYPVQQLDSGGQTLVNAVAFSPDGASVLVGSQDGTAHLWDRRTGQEQRVFTHPGGDLWGVAFSPDGATILAGVAGGVQLWDARTGAQLRFLKVDGGVGSVAFSPDGGRLLIGSTDEPAVLIVDRASGRELRRLTGHPAGIWRAVFSPDGRFVLSSGGDARLWETESGRLVHVLFGNTGDVQGVAFSPDGATVATGEGGTIRIWDAASGRELRQLVGHKPVVRSLAFTPDGKQLVSASDDATVRVWDVATGAELRRLVGHTSTVFSVDVSPDGRYAASGSLDATALIWDLQAAPVSPRITAKDGITGVAYTPDGKQVVTTSIDGTATVSDAATGHPIRSFTAPAPISVAALAPGGAYLLAGCADATIYALELATGQELRRFVGQPTFVATLAISPDGKYLVSGGVNDPDHYLWDAQSGVLLRRLKGHTYANTFATAFSPDSRFVVTGGYDYTARVWEVATGREVRRISFPADGAAHGASSVAYSPDGTHILTGSWDGVVRLWDAESGALVHSYVGHSGAVFASAFSPDGRLILTGSTDRTARLWDTQTGVEVRRLAGHTGDVTSVAFAPQGEKMATGSADGSARLWDTDVQETVAALCTRLIHDFTAAERAQFGIIGSTPTCPATP